MLGCGGSSFDLIEIGRSGNAIAGQVKKPRERQGNRKSERNRNNDEPSAPHREIERRKNARHELDQARPEDHVADRNAIDLASL